MMRKALMSLLGFVLLLGSLIGQTVSASSTVLLLPQTSLAELKTKLESQYREIENVIAFGPSRASNLYSYPVGLRYWQDRLAQRFGEAAVTVESILNLNPANAEIWRERLETLRLYSQPISPPERRSVYGSREVQKRARLIETPVAVCTDEARARKIRGEVRLRVVLAADGTVKNVFPIKSLRYGLTDSAIEAARRIKFDPAIRKGQPVSQFATFVYEFKKNGAQPYIPITVF
jgi:TonB family protein